MNFQKSFVNIVNNTNTPTSTNTREPGEEINIPREPESLKKKTNNNNTSRYFSAQKLPTSKKHIPKPTTTPTTAKPPPPHSLKPILHKQIYVSLTEQLKSEIKEEGGKALMNTKTRNQYPTNENRTNIKMSNNTKTTDLEVRHKAITELKRTKFIAMYI
ncbi:hypothetical protein M8J75_005028 [Diaphorina citri]|nr:hypothetical protein M8J75_005028 [Diaphorina citri]